MESLPLVCRVSRGRLVDVAGAMGWVSVPCCSGSRAVVSGCLLVCPRRAVEGSCGWACRLPGKRCCCGTGKAVRCDGWCSALRWAMQRAAMAGAACCVCRASAQAGSALCGESREGMPWSRAASVPSLSGKPGFLSVASSCIVLCAMVFSPPCGGFLVRKPHFAFPIALLCARFAARKRKLLYLCDRMRTHVHTHTQ